MDRPYDPTAIAAVEHKLKLVAQKYPDTRADMDEAIGLLSGQWARLTMVRQAVK